MSDIADTTIGRFFAKCFVRHMFTVAGVLIAGAFAWNDIVRDVDHIQLASQANTSAVQSLDVRLGTIERKQDRQSEKIDGIQRSIEEDRKRDKESREDLKRSLDRIFEQLNKSR